MNNWSTAWTAESKHDIEYGRVGDISLQMDAHIPDGKGPFPAIILVHGGAWVRGDRQWNVEPLFRPLEDANFAWFSISYRLANDVLTFGSAVEDVQQAVRFVRTHAKEYNVDPSRIALVGESAGAQLASMAALSADTEDSVNAVVALYGPADLVSLARTSPLVPERIRQAIAGSPLAPFIEARLRQLSPIEHISKNMPPFLLIHGTADTVVPYSQSEAFCERVHKAGGSCELYTVKGGGHGIRSWQRSANGNGYAKEMVDWLKGKLAA
jgi:alpha-L-fucosidase 2